MKKLTLILLLMVSVNVFADALSIGPPSILPQCLDKRDPSDYRIMGPSSRARECTRQYCASDVYVNKIKEYAMSIQQSVRDAMDALTCITRKEQDLKD